MTTAISADLRARRDEVVNQHIDAENRHDPDGVVASFHQPCYDIPSFGEAGQVNGARLVQPDTDGPAAHPQPLADLGGGQPVLLVEPTQLRLRTPWCQTSSLLPLLAVLMEGRPGRVVDCGRDVVTRLLRVGTAEDPHDGR